MNYQNNMSCAEVDFIMQQDPNIPKWALQYYAWPQLYGNTGGPFANSKGIYGAAMSMFTIDCWAYIENDVVIAYLFCNEKFIKKVENFNIFYAIGGKY